MIATVFAMAALLAAYIFIVRPVLRARPQFAGLAARADGWWSRLGARLKGWRTILWARFLVLAGILLPLLDAARTIDLAALLPPGYVAYAPLILTGIGIVTETLRRLTTTPVGQPEAEA
jgi:hypothetical protein